MNLTEQKHIISSTNPNLEFIRIWTQKEAYLKLKGTGIITDLHNTLAQKQDIVWKEVSNLQLEYICTIAVEKD
jgi:phosphopantetheinyl transferase